MCASLGALGGVIDPGTLTTSGALASTYGYLKATRDQGGGDGSSPYPMLWTAGGQTAMKSQKKREELLRNDIFTAAASARVDTGAVDGLGGLFSDAWKV